MSAGAPEEVGVQLDRFGEARYEGPELGVLRQLPVETYHWSTLEKETAMNLDTRSNEAHISTSERGGVTALLRHDQAEFVSATLVGTSDSPAIQYVYAILPIGCITVKERARKNTNLSSVFKS